jgi:hypothetical protein
MDNTLTEFLSSLTKTPQLFVLILGSFLLALSGTDSLPIAEGVPMATATRIACGVLGAVLILYSLWALYGNEKFRITKDERELKKKDSKIADLREYIVQKESKINDLEQLIIKAKDKANESGYDEIIDLLNGVEDLVSTASDKWRILGRAANWIQVRTNSEEWTRDIKPSDFSEYGINRQNIDEFKNELNQHLKVLQKNLNEMKPDGLPCKRGASQKIATNRLAYKDALQTVILPKLEEELECDEILEDEACEQIRHYMRTLIRIADH